MPLRLRARLNAAGKPLRLTASAPVEEVEEAGEVEEYGEELCASCGETIASADAVCGSCGGARRQTISAAGSRTFDESKVRRIERGQHGGGRFTVKENAAGRFEVLNEQGKKVAETTDEADAHTVADEKNVENAMQPPAVPPDASGLTIPQDRLARIQSLAEAGARGETRSDGPSIADYSPADLKQALAQGEFSPEARAGIDRALFLQNEGPLTPETLDFLKRAGVQQERIDAMKESGRFIGIEEMPPPSSPSPVEGPYTVPDATSVMENLSVSAPIAGPDSGLSKLTDTQLAEEIKTRTAESTRILHGPKEGGAARVTELVDSLNRQRAAENEMTRRAVVKVAPSEGTFEQIDKIGKTGGGMVGTSHVRRLADGNYEVYEPDRHGGSQKITKFQGTREEVAAYAQRAYDQSRAYASEAARRAADSAIGGSDWNKGRVTLTLGQVPNDWAVENGYAETSTYKAHGAGAGMVDTIRWKPGINPERVLFHFLSGKPAPSNFPEGTQAAEQWSYGRGKLKGKNKAESEAIIRRITAALVAAGFRFDNPTLVAAGLPTEEQADEPCSECAELEALVAAIPVKPPSDWFELPKLDAPTPMTITDDGRIYGHAAAWGTCHLGNPRGAGVCVQPPRSQTDYALFHLGEVETDSGARVPVGQITLDTGHAPMGASARTAAAHYDDTGTCVADVVAGEDEHGIVFSGALRPDVTPERARKLMGSKISGDWRGGELVGMLAVNVPGFPIPRARMVASAEGVEEVMTLVAAGVVFERSSVEKLPVETAVKVLAARAEGVEALVALAES